MYIKTVILEGFKSYASRTTIGDFDPHFNAITGLNGSGKSNILDGIVFVLGLSALGTVRAQNLGDLITKGGNVKRASVSVVFDNANKRKSPLGYEKFPEITVSRNIEEGSCCKYYLNGANVTKKELQNMFESVQLNINNPNFMIMQGKITKVVNMKPKEILGMVEESIGAVSYQAKRDKASRDLEDKGKQIQEIQEMLTNIIEPAIRKQQAAHQIFEQFKIVKRERDQHCQEYAIAAYGSFTQQQKDKMNDIQKSTDSEQQDREAIESNKSRIEVLTQERVGVKDDISKLVAEKLSKLEKNLKDEHKKFSLTEGAWDDAVATVKECETKLKRSKKALETEQKQNENAEQQKGELIAEFNSVKSAMEAAESSLAAAKEKESEIQAGKVMGDDGQTFDLREKICSLDEEIQAIKPTHDYETLILNNEKKSLAEKETQLKKTPSDQQIEQNFQRAKQTYDTVTGQMRRNHIDPEEYPQVDRLLGEVSQKLGRYDANYRDMLRRNHRLEFSYQDPYPNFNRASVHGCFYEMFEIENLERYKNAMEVGAGGCFDIVIVDNPDVSKAIIKNGQVARRRSYMPLTSIQNNRRVVTQNELDRKLGPDKAVPAVAIVKCDPKYEKVINFYLGNLVICDTMATAKIVAFQMKHKAVTLDGDLCDPDGAMQGGTRRNCGDYVVCCQKIREINIERKRLIQEHEELKRKHAHYRQHEGLLKSFDKANRDLQNATEERRCTAYATLVAEVDQLKASVESRIESLKTSTEKLAVLTKEKDKLAHKLSTYDQEKSKSLKAAKAEVTKWTKALEDAKRKYNLQEKSFNNVEMDLKAKEARLADYQQDIATAEKELEDAKADEVQKKSKLEEARSIFQARKREEDEASSEKRELEDQLKKIDAEIAKCTKILTKIDLDKIKRDNNRKNLETQLKEITATINQLVHKHPELDLPNNYDSLEKPRHNLKKCKEIMDATQKKYEDLRQKVDERAAQQLDESKEKQKSANEKLHQLYSNQKKLREAIVQLDKQKAEMVRSAYRSVNEEFGKMMSTLLPESTAKLVPVSGREDNLDDGVNIHVQLGGVWKESLTELSGGQRSLVALALVLSLCMYQPAPFYVLDEIDAALDLSHTQNIGVLIKERFKDTQFICVSLKDGMFSNANVLFQTQFMDGKSVVTRSAKESRAQVTDAAKYANLGKKREKGRRV